MQLILKKKRRREKDSYEADPEKHRGRKKVSYEADPEKYKRRKKVAYEADPDKKKSQVRKYKKKLNNTKKRLKQVSQCYARYRDPAARKRIAQEKHRDVTHTNILKLSEYLLKCPKSKGFKRSKSSARALAEFIMQKLNALHKAAIRKCYHAFHVCQKKSINDSSLSQRCCRHTIQTV